MEEQKFPHKLAIQTEALKKSLSDGLPSAFFNYQKESEEKFNILFKELSVLKKWVSKIYWITFLITISNLILLFILWRVSDINLWNKVKPFIYLVGLGTISTFCSLALNVLLIYKELKRWKSDSK